VRHVCDGCVLVRECQLRYLPSHNNSESDGSAPNKYGHTAAMFLLVQTVVVSCLKPVIPKYTFILPIV
jgi:hypothetical protein